jgi:hypothetical protein
MVPSDLVTLNTVEVIPSKLSVGCPLFENVIGSGEYRMGDSYDCALLTSPAGQSAILGLKFMRDGGKPSPTGGVRLLENRSSLRVFEVIP